MKNISACFAVVFAALTLCAGVPGSIKFSTQGPDTYKDGSVVMDGEVYALVWVKSGSEFAGLKADGSLVNATDNKIISRAAIAQDGHCPTVVYIINGEASELTNGTFAVYLLDTRKTAVSADGATYTTTVGPVDGSYENVAFNGYAKVDAEISTVKSGEAGSVAVSQATALPDGVKNPKVVGFTVVDGKCEITVEDTVPYLNYTVSGGETLADMNHEIGTGINGTADGTIILQRDLDALDASDFRFFKVVRSGTTATEE